VKLFKHSSLFLIIARKKQKTTELSTLANVKDLISLYYLLYINIENIILDPGRGWQAAVVVITSLSSDLRLQRQSDEPTIARRCLIMKRAVY